MSPLRRGGEVEAEESVNQQPWWEGAHIPAGGSVSCLKGEGSLLAALQELQEQGMGLVAQD